MSIPEYTLPHFSFQAVRVRFYPRTMIGNTQAVEINVTAVVCLLPEAKPGELKFARIVPTEWLRTEQQRHREVRQTIRNFLEHELDEQLLCDGVRVTDPHPERGERS